MEVIKFNIYDLLNSEHGIAYYLVGRSYDLISL